MSSGVTTGCNQSPHVVSEIFVGTEGFEPSLEAV